MISLMANVHTPLPDYAIPPRYLRWVLVGAAVVFLVWFLLQAITAVIPFAIALLLALVLDPVVDHVMALLPRFRRLPAGARRVTAILLVYAAVIGALTGLGFWLVPVVGDEVQALIDDAPAIIDDAEVQLQGAIDWYEDHIPSDVRVEIEKNVGDIGGRVGDWLLGLVTSAVDRVVGGVFTIVGYFVIPFFLFYLLKDGKHLRPWAAGLFPPPLRADADLVLHRMARTFASYLRAQLALGLLIGVVTGVGLWIMEVRFPAALGLAAGFTELIPFVGPFLGAIPAMVVVLATDPEKWWWLVVFYLAVQQLEGQILVPVIHGRVVTLHPAAVMVLVVMGGAVFGIAGVLVVVPIAAALRDAFVYIYQRLNGDLPPPLPASAPGPAPGPLVPPPS